MISLPISLMGRNVSSVLFTIQLIVFSIFFWTLQVNANQGKQSDALFGQPYVTTTLQHQVHPEDNNLLHDKSRIQDHEHIRKHLGEIINEPDLNKLSEEEAQFYYFKSHDSDNNNMLDGSELIKSIIHWHAEKQKHHEHDSGSKIFTDIELANLIDPILQNDDLNKDGYIDYPEFVAAQKARVSKANN